MTFFFFFFQHLAPFNQKSCLGTQCWRNSTAAIPLLTGHKLEPLLLCPVASEAGLERGGQEGLESRDPAFPLVTV